MLVLPKIKAILKLWQTISFTMRYPGLGEKMCGMVWEKQINGKIVAENTRYSFSVVLGT